MTDRYLFTPLRTPLTPVTPKTGFGDVSNRLHVFSTVKARLVLDENSEIRDRESDPELHIGTALQQGPDLAAVAIDVEELIHMNRLEVENWSDEAPETLLPVQELSPVDDLRLSQSDSELAQEGEIDQFAAACVSEMQF